MPSPESLRKDVFYHIYNRGINGETIFPQERNYYFFMNLYAQYIEPVAVTYAYALLKNHFHFLVRTKMPREQEAMYETIKTLKDPESFRVWKIWKKGYRVLDPSQQFSNFFNAYAKAINKTFQRTGSLFEHPFKRKVVGKDAYFQRLVAYIHQNPQIHGLIDDFRLWPFSSYQALESRKATYLQRDTVWEWYGGREAFVRTQSEEIESEQIESLIIEDPGPDPDQTLKVSETFRVLPE